MVQALIISHGDFGEALLKSAFSIVGQQPQVRPYVFLDEKMEKDIAELQKEGVAVVCQDLPSNPEYPMKDKLGH